MSLLRAYYPKLQKVDPTKLTLNTTWNSTDGNLIVGQVGWVGDWQMGDGSVKSSEVNLITHAYAAGLDGQTKVIKAYGTHHATNQLALLAKKLVGMLDMSKLTDYRGVYDLRNNNLTGVKFPNVSGLTGAIDGSGNANLTGAVDLTPLAGGHGGVAFNGTAITSFKSSEANTLNAYNFNPSNSVQTINIGTRVSSFQMTAGAALNTLNARRVQTEVPSLFFVQSVPLLTRINSDTEFICDLTNFKGGLAYLLLYNTGVKHVTLASETSAGFMSPCTIQDGKAESINLGGQRFNGGNISINGNANLTSFSMGTTGNVVATFNAAITKLNQTYGFGTKMTCTNIHLASTWHSQANVNANINDVYVNRAAFNNTVNKPFNISGANNAAPSGVLQAPAGFVLGESDGTPTTAREQIYVLVNQQVSTTDTAKKYKWQFTTN